MSERHSADRNAALLRLTASLVDRRTGTVAMRREVLATQEGTGRHPLIAYVTAVAQVPGIDAVGLILRRDSGLHIDVVMQAIWKDCTEDPNKRDVSEAVVRETEIRNAFERSAHRETRGYYIRATGRHHPGELLAQSGSLRESWDGDDINQVVSHVSIRFV